MWLLSKKRQKNIDRILEFSKNDLEYITSVINEIFQAKCKISETEEFKTTKFEEIYENLAMVRDNAIKDIDILIILNKGKNVKKEKIPQKIINILDNYFSDILVHAKEIEKEEKLYINDMKKKLEFYRDGFNKSDKKVKKLKVFLYLLSIGVIFLNFSLALIETLSSSKDILGKLYGKEYLLAVIIVDVFIFLLASFFTVISFSFLMKISEKIKDPSLQILLRSIPLSLISSYFIWYSSDIINNADKALVLSTIKFINNILSLDPISLFLTFVAALATLDALINFFQRCKKFWARTILRRFALSGEYSRAPKTNITNEVKDSQM